MPDQTPTIEELQNRFQQVVQTFSSDLGHECGLTKKLDGSTPLNDWIADRVLPMNQALLQTVLELLALQNASFSLQSQEIYDDLTNKIHAAGFADAGGFLLDSDHLVAIIRLLNDCYDALPKEALTPAMDEEFSLVIEPLMDYAVDNGLIEEEEGAEEPDGELPVETPAPPPTAEEQPEEQPEESSGSSEGEADGQA